MFKPHKAVAKPAEPSTTPSAQVLALIERARARSLRDADLSRLLKELAPYLPQGK